MIVEILNSFRLNLEFLRHLVDDLSDEQMVCQPAGVVNHPAWVIGHLARSFQQLGEEIGIEPWLDDDWKRRFGTGSLPVGTSESYPRRSELFHALNDGQRRITDRLIAIDEAEPRNALPDVR
jgi:hypothetical protein